MRRSVRFVLGLTNSSTICRQTGLGLSSRLWGHARPRVRPSALGFFFTHPALSSAGSSLIRRRPLRSS
jgi:hypothetical protein